VTRKSRSLIASAAALACLGWSWPWQAEPPVTGDERPLEEPMDGYVSSKTCESCHPGPYASWHDSYHRTMTQVATRDTALGDFDFAELELNGRKFLLGHTGKSLWVELDHAGGRVRREIALSTGSHHDQMYWYTSPGMGRDLTQLPFDWSIRLGSWIPAASSFLISPTIPAEGNRGMWNSNCMNCHTTRPETRLIKPKPRRRANKAQAEASYETRVAEFGIACEACHGPGQTHIEANSNPKRRYELYAEGNDSTIVNPKRLPYERSAEVCGQCHSARFPYADVMRYQPGDELADHAAVVTHAYRDPEYVGKDSRRRARITEMVGGPNEFWDSTFWPDGMIRVSGREYIGLVESPCFQRGELQCISCHDLHQASSDERPRAEWANDQLDPERTGNAACTQCHGEYVEPKTLAEHTHHAADSIGSNCYDCHMPHTAYGIQKAHRTHQVTSPDVASALGAGRSNGCNQCHLDKSLGWTADYLEQWYEIPAPELAPEDRTLSAGVRWAVSGDAGQRALMAWAMGWETARQTAGSDWMIPFLIQLLDDPYDSVRFIAQQSLLARPEYASDKADWHYSLDASRTHRQPHLLRAREIYWENWPRGVRDAPSSVLFEGGQLMEAEMRKLLAKRDDKPMYLAE